MTATAPTTETRDVVADQPRCPGTGQLALVPNSDGDALCDRCGQHTATRPGPHGLPVYAEHTGNPQTRRCAVCGGATPSRLHRHCSARCWRAEEPDAFDDEAFDDFDPPWLAAEDLGGE